MQGEGAEVGKCLVSLGRHRCWRGLAWESHVLPSPAPLGFLADLQGPSSTVTEQSRLCADVCMNLATHTSVTEDTPGSEVLSHPRSSVCGVCARVRASVCLARVGFLVHGASDLSEEPS